MRAVLIATWVIALVFSAQAQEKAPFDMSPELPAQSEPQAAPAKPVERQEKEPEAKQDEKPEPQQEEQEEKEATPPAETTPLPQPPQPAKAEPPFRRFLLPNDVISLAGEQARRNWAIYLSPRQAASAATLTFGYRNAVVVAPEASSLSVTVNGRAVYQKPIESSEAIAKIDVPIPAGLLRSGRNEIGFSAVHRHRTDCTIESIYELWTEIVADETFLSFADEVAGKLVSQDELPTVGGTASGKAHIVIVAPELARFDIAADVMRLAQALAHHISSPDIEISVDTRPPEEGDVTLIVLLGAASELASLGYNMPDVNGPFSAFAETQPGETPVFIVSGRDRGQWSTALDSVVSPVDRPLDVQRDVILTEGWRTPNAPMILADSRLSFAELGLRSEQFSGRRYRAEFEFGMPSDFYAEAYGTASILLDAAYTSEVQPGSLINVYVNGNIAASMPITTTRGAVLNHFPIKFTMRHVVPGLNRIVLEAQLRTAADQTCSPGAAAGDTPRFALFDTSQFAMPTFARIARRPNLSALAGTGSPYNRATEPIAVLVDRSTNDGLSTLATLLGRMARAAGRILPVEFVASRDAIGRRDAIILGSVSEIPTGVLNQVGISDESRASWGGSASTGEVRSGPSLEQWRRQVTGSWFSTARRDFGDWFQRTFNMTSEMLRFAPEEEPAFLPPPSAGLIFAQRGNPAGTGVWTVVAAPDKSSLRTNMAAFTELRNWNKLSGRITTYNPATEETETVNVGQFEFIETMPPSIWNYRLIVANWLSTNILSYPVILILACGLLGGVTTFLLGSLGRSR